MKDKVKTNTNATKDILLEYNRLFNNKFNGLNVSLKRLLNIENNNKLNLELKALRNESIKWIFNLSESLQLNIEIIFKAVQLADLAVFSNFEPFNLIIDSEDVRLSIIICLNLACKLEDKSLNFYEILFKYFNKNKFKTITKRQYFLRELEILEKINFNLNSDNFYSVNLTIQNYILNNLTNEQLNNNNNININNNYKEEFKRINLVTCTYYSYAEEALTLRALDSALIVNLITLNLLKRKVDDSGFIKTIKSLIKQIIKICYGKEYLNEFINISNRIIKIL